MDDIQRLFFALEAHAPWPYHLPQGRLLQESERHMTLVFIGECNASLLLQSISDFPKPPFPFALTGLFDTPLLLPHPRRPNVAAWHVELFENEYLINDYYRTFERWLFSRGFLKKIEERPFLPHVTLARAPLDAKGWMKNFVPLPVTFPTLHLYQSLGNLTYRPIWSHPLHPAFVPIEHTADLAFHLYGRSIQEIGLHALSALWNEGPELLAYHEPMTEEDYQTIESLIAYLNRLVSRADREIGTRLKAVSYHGDVKLGESGYLEWEMIVDV